MRKKRIFVQTSVSVIALFLAVYFEKTVVNAETAHEIAKEIQKKQELSLPLGEKIENPWNETVESSNEELFGLTEDGYLEARGSGEVEVVVRYRVKIEGDFKDSDIPRPILTGREEKSEEMQEPGIREEEKEIKTEETTDVPEIENQDEKDTDTAEEDTGGQEGDQSKIIDTEQITDKEQQDSQNNTPSAMDSVVPVLQPKQDKPVITYDEALKNMVVSSDFIPRIHLRDADQYEIISCAVNGREESFQIEGSDLVISQQALGSGKNRIMVTVKDKGGKIYVMEPWEFAIEEQDKSMESQNAQEQFQQIDKSLYDYEQEQGASLGMLLLLTGGSFVLYEKKRYGKQK